MTSAFYVFRLEPAWYKFQALAKPVSGQFASKWAPDLWAEESVYPAVAVMAMGWKSACGLLQQIHRKLRFLPKPMGAGLDPSREVGRDGPVPRSGRPHDTSFYSVYLDGFSHAEVKHWDQLSRPERCSWEAEAVHEAWDRWGVPSQTGKAIVNVLELETLGCRIDGNAGVIAPPRSVVGRLIGLTAWFVQFRKEVSSLFVHYWDWLHSQENVSRKRAIGVSRGVLEDLLLALCRLPLMLFDLRLRTSPLVLASDASATGLGVCRTSSLEPKGLLALAAFQEGHNFRGEGIGLIEVGTTPGGVRQAFARLKVMPGAHAIVGARDESK